MKQAIQSTVRAAYVVFVALALTFAVGQLYAGSGSAVQECDDPSQVGSCPPLVDESCECACMDIFGTSGACIEGCCTCQVRS